MLTSAECKVQAEQKLAQAERDERHRKRLITAAEAWLFLASQLRRVEAAFPNDEAVAKRRSKDHMKANVAVEFCIILTTFSLADTIMLGTIFRRGSLAVREDNGGVKCHAFLQENRTLIGRPGMRCCSHTSRFPPTNSIQRLMIRSFASESVK